MTASTAAAYVTDPAPAATPLAAPAPVHIAASGLGVDFQLHGRRQRVLHDINLSVPKESPLHRYRSSKVQVQLGVGVEYDQFLAV